MYDSLYTLGWHTQRRWWRKHLLLIAAAVVCLNLALITASWHAVPASWWTTGFMAVPDWLTNLHSIVSGSLTALLAAAWYLANEHVLVGYRRASDAILTSPRLFFRQALACCLINGAILYITLWAAVLATNVLARIISHLADRPLSGLGVWSGYPGMLPIAVVFLLGILLSIRQAHTMRFQPLEGLAFVVLSGLLTGANL